MLNVPVKRSHNSREGRDSINGLKQTTMECQLIPTAAGRVTLRHQVRCMEPSLTSSSLAFPMPMSHAADRDRERAQASNTKTAPVVVNELTSEVASLLRPLSVSDRRDSHAFV